MNIKQTVTDSQWRPRWLLWVAYGITFLILGIAGGVFGLLCALNPYVAAAVFMVFAGVGWILRLHREKRDR